jgi:hypothetical protein
MGRPEMRMHNEPDTKAVRELNRRIRDAAKKASEDGLDLATICNALENRSTFARYIEQCGAREYPWIKPEPSHEGVIANHASAATKPRNFLHLRFFPSGASFSANADFEAIHFLLRRELTGLRILGCTETRLRFQTRRPTQWSHYSPAKSLKSSALSPSRPARLANQINSDAGGYVCELRGCN